VIPALLCPAYVSVARRDITVSPFAMQTAFPPSDYYELIRLPKRISLTMPRFDNSADSPQSHLNDCFAWTSTALQASSIRTTYYRSDANTSGTRIPYGLANSLSTLRAGCSAGCSIDITSISQERVHFPLPTRNTQDSIRVTG